MFNEKVFPLRLVYLPRKLYKAARVYTVAMQVKSIESTFLLTYCVLILWQYNLVEERSSEPYLAQIQLLLLFRRKQAHNQIKAFIV